MARKTNLTGDEYTKIFPFRLRKIMESRNITQKDLAAEIGKTRQAVSYYTDGSSSPDWETLAKIASFLRVSSDYLLGLSDIEEPNLDIRGACKITGLSEKAIKTICGEYDPYFSFDSPKKALNSFVESANFGAFIDAICRLKEVKETESFAESYLRTQEGVSILKNEVLRTVIPYTQIEEHNLSSEVDVYIQSLMSSILEEEKGDQEELAIFRVQKEATKIAEEIVSMVSNEEDK